MSKHRQPPSAASKAIAHGTAIGMLVLVFGAFVGISTGDGSLYSLGFDLLGLTAIGGIVATFVDYLRHPSED